jgi:hypothetical protein
MSTNQPFDYSILPAAITGVVSVALFITSFVLTSMALGSDSKWEKVRTEVMTKVWPLTLVGTIVFFGASIIYLLQEPKSMMYFLLVVSCLSLGISYSTLVMSVMST